VKLRRTAGAVRESGPPNQHWLVGRVAPDLAEAVTARRAA